MTSERRRADRVLVERGLFESRARAQDAIRAGLVTAEGRKLARASDVIAVDAAIAAEATHPYVSRGALKLEAALDTFALDPAGLTCLDVGASTGGFTEILLKRGAARVVALDVGRGQLHARLRDDPRIDLREGTDIRDLAPVSLSPLPSFASVDVSFIALRLVLPAILGCLAPGAALVALIKPQFEAGRERVGRGGIVRDESVQEAVCAEVRSGIEALGCTILGLIPSPIEGGDGNREFLIGARKAGAVG